MDAARLHPPMPDGAARNRDDSAPALTISDPDFTQDYDCFEYRAWLSDELSGCLWHLDWRRSFNGELGTRPVGGDINIGNAWTITKGGNVNVAVVDDTWNPNHHDLADNIDLAHSHNYAPYPLTESDAAHASMVAGVIAARDNELGGRGIAPRATLFNYNLVEDSATENQADAMRRNAEIVAVSNNSYSYAAAIPDFQIPGNDWWEAVDYGLEHGFGGLGTTYVFGAGNLKSKVQGSDLIISGQHAHPGVISACAVGNDGGETQYSQTGVSLWICAPANDRDYETNLTIGNTLLSTYGDNDYRGFGRTSAAAAEVSGIAALIRSANPYLSWRDVKLILAQTAQKNDPAHPDWSDGSLHYGSTARRYNFNPNYGFGVADASAAVNAALTWKRVPELVNRVVKSGGPEYQTSHLWNNPDSWDALIRSDGETTELTLQGPSDIDFLEHAGVSLYLYSTHGRDLRIELVSPSGTTSTLIDAIESRTWCGNAGWKGTNWCNLYFQELKLDSNEFLGEDPAGTWRLRITDPLTHEADGWGRTTLYSWELRLLGHQGASSDTTPRARLRVNNASGLSANVNEGERVRVTASLTGRTLSHDVVIPVSVEPGTATQADYSASGTVPVRIRAGHRSGSETFDITRDNLSERDEIFTVRWPDPHGTSAPSSVLLLGDPVEVTINGNLPPPAPPRTVTLEATPSTVVEGGAVQITARLSGGPWTRSISLPVEFGEGTARGPGLPRGNPDYYPLTQDGGSITFIRIPAGETSVTLRMETSEDDNWAGIEPPETVSLIVHRPAGLRGEVAVAGSPLNITIVETDVPQYPAVSVSAGPPVVEGSEAVFTLRAAPAPASPLRVAVQVGGAGGFAAAASRTVTIPVSGSAALRILTIGDSTDEPDGTVTATVRAGTGYDVSPSQASASVTVRDDDDALVITPPANSCGQALSGDGTVSGSWAPGCKSSEQSRGYARYYTFTLARQSRVTIDLESSVDTYLFLRAGGARSGYSLHQNDDVVPGSDTDSRIAATLSAGTYTIEATTYPVDRTGTFTLEIAGLGATAPPPPATPEVSITAGSSITEGGNASFTLTASPAPAAALPVTVAVSQTGAYGAATGLQTVYIPATGRQTFTIATTGDSADEPDGSVTATVRTGAGYTVSSTAGTATVTVRDDDDAPATVCSQLPSDAITVAEVTGWRDALDPTRAAAGIKRWNRVLAALGEDTGETPMTAAQARGVANWLGNTRWDRTARTLEALAQCDNPPPPATPQVSITAGNTITEGGNASFTLRASPAPAAALPVAIVVSQTGAYGAATGSRTVNIPNTGSYILTVATTDDSSYESDGSVTVTVNTGTGYTVSATAGSATVAVADDDNPPPATLQVSITAGSSITEGGNASFTLTASPAPAAALPVTVLVSQSGAYGAATGLQTVYIPTTGSQTFTIATTGDSADEPDGSVTATVRDGTGYDISQSQASASVTVRDDDDAPVITPPANSCAQALSADGAVSGSWAPGCQLSDSARGYARYYTFALDGQSEVTIALKSGVDAYLFLRSGNGVTSGAALHEDDDGGYVSDSEITATLSAGTYTIEATTYYPNKRGGFTLEISGLGSAPPPPPVCTPQLPSDAITVAEVTVWRDNLDPARAAAGIKRWNRVLEALGEDTGTGLAPMPATLAREVANWLKNDRWDRTARTLEAMEQCDG